MRRPRTHRGWPAGRGGSWATFNLGPARELAGPDHAPPSPPAPCRPLARTGAPPAARPARLVVRRSGRGPDDGRRAQVRNTQRQAGPRPGPHIDRRRLHADRHDLQQPDPRQPRAQGRAAARPSLGGQRGQLGVDVPPRQERQVHQRPSGHRPRRQVLVRAHPRPGDRVQGPQGHGADRDHHRRGRSHPGHQARRTLRGPAASARQHLRPGHRRGEPGGDQPQPGRLGAFTLKEYIPATRRSW